MDKRITELVSNLQPEAVEFRFEDELLTARIKSRVSAAVSGQPRKRKKWGLSLLIAAVVAMLTVGTVAAVVVSQMSRRELSDEVVYNHGSAEETRMNCVWTDATLGFDFEIEGECREVYVRPGWLPVPDGYGNADADGFRTYGASGQDYGTNAWELEVLWGNRLRDTTWFLSGNAEIIEESSWNGFHCLKVTVYRDHSNLPNVHYLLLFSSADNYLIRLCSLQGFDTLEKMAEELEIRVTDTVVLEAPVTDSELFSNQPLDMDGHAGRKDFRGNEESVLNLRFDGTGEADVVVGSAIEADAPKVFFRTGWVPENGIGTADRWTRCWPEKAQETGNYTIRLYWADMLMGTTFFFHPEYGNAQIVLEDTWNGFSRIEVVETERCSVDGQQLPDLNHLFLLDAETPYLIHIDGTIAMETLEKIAENLEFRITDEGFKVDAEERFCNLSLRGYEWTEPDSAVESPKATVYIPMEQREMIRIIIPVEEYPDYSAVCEPGWLPKEPTSTVDDIRYWHISCVDDAMPGMDLYTVHFTQEYPRAYPDNLAWTGIAREDGNAELMEETVLGGMDAWIFRVTDRYDFTAMEAYAIELENGDMETEQFRLPDRYEICLWSDAAKGFAWISGTADLGTLKQIAENLKITLSKQLRQDTVNPPIK